ncbi:MAG: prepilin-type N-terminal cleavage/methylation domain-containing protein [Gammaproteobacteria bacterium]|nr:prepilin-type N-terminal cleavage/methylation domain-containing protein [Gammaproteobacteria bacterium]
MTTLHDRQRGFTLISALFVVVVVAVLGVYLATLGTAQHTSTALSVRAAQAMYMAHSGIDWVIYRLEHGDSCATLPGSVTIDGYTVAVQRCVTQIVSEGGVAYPVHEIEVDASIGSFGSPGYVRRVLSVSVTGA